MKQPQRSEIPQAPKKALIDVNDDDDDFGDVDVNELLG